MPGESIPGTSSRSQAFRTSMARFLAKRLVCRRAEQRAIAAFLDRETARIDALVAKNERLIELLQEKRTSLITRAVTRGLEPTVPLRDSGVEWLGQIPAHWEADRIKWAALMVSGHTPDKKVDSYWRGGDIPWVSLADTGQLRQVDYIANTAVFTTADGIAHSSAHVLPEGTVVFSRDATIGLCAITRAGMAVSQHFIGWVCGLRLRPEYLLFVLRSMTRELERLTMGATVLTIGMPDVRSLAVPIPPLAEQDHIVPRGVVPPRADRRLGRQGPRGRRPAEGVPHRSHFRRSHGQDRRQAGGQRLRLAAGAGSWTESEAY